MKISRFFTTSSVYTLVAVAVSLIVTNSANGQQAVVATPNHNVGHSFFESNGTAFGFGIPTGGIRPGGSGVVGLNPLGQVQPNINFNQGGGVNNAAPQFGGFNPAAGANFGFGTVGGGINPSFGLGMSQGSNTTFTSNTPSVTVPNGGQGTIINATQRPFVTSVIPVVGGYGVVPGGFNLPNYPMDLTSGPSYLETRIGEFQRQAAIANSSPGEDLRQVYMAREAEASGSSTGSSTEETGGLRLRGASSANRGDLSIADIEAQQAAAAGAAQQEVLSLIDNARDAASRGKTGAAKIYYRQAIRRAEGELKSIAESELSRLQ